MFYKIINGDSVVDVLFGASWVCLGKHGRPVLCDVRKATGVVSSDGSTIYHIDGAPFLGDYADVVIVCIEEAEAVQLKEQLDIGNVPAEPDPPITEPENPGEEDTGTEETPVMGAAAMRQRIIDLENQNAMLVECLLEMSEVVYSGL